MRAKMAVDAGQVRIFVKKALEDLEGEDGGTREQRMRAARWQLENVLRYLDGVEDMIVVFRVEEGGEAVIHYERRARKA